MPETITINLETAARGPAGADGAATFIALTDAPSSYTGQGLKFVRVNSGGTALEFVTASGTGDALVASTLDQFADVTQTSGATLAITASTTLSGGTHSGVNTGDQTSVTGNAGTVTTINGRIAEGTNVTLTGAGTAADPYVINAAGGGGGTWGSITGTLTDQTDLQAILDEKLDVTTAASTYQAALVSGTNIKTINGTSVLGSGNITVTGGSGISSDITGLTGGTEIYNIVGITKAGYALIGAPDANTYYIITDASMGDYGFPVLGEWTADTAATTATPSPGQLRWNNATQTSATNLYLDSISAGAVDLGAMLLLVGNGDKILLQSGAANYQLWQLSAAPSLSSGNWTLPVTLLSSAGTGTTGFADLSALIVAVRPAGERRLITDYTKESALTSSASISVDAATVSQPTLTLAHNTTITFSNMVEGQQLSLSGIMGGSGGYTVALAHSGLTVRMMGGVLAQIAALATNDLFEISVKRSATDLRVWIATLEI